MDRVKAVGYLLLALIPLGATHASLAEDSDRGQHALLVGCTKYPQLVAKFQLRGGSNDVEAMNALLTETFKFQPKNIVRLVEEADAPEFRPTYANIEREFANLAAKAQAGDQVVILLSGHGCQQPDLTHDPNTDPEPDGSDEVFLPSDVGSWPEAAGKLAMAPEGTKVANSIVDDQIAVWLKAIRSKKASVFVIFDACHSGTLIRGNDTEMIRQVPAEALIPQAILDQATAQSRGQGGKAIIERSASFGDVDSGPGLVALYAVQPDQPTIELNLPPGDTNAKPFGLLTRALCEVLANRKSTLTYRELPERVQAQFIRWDRAFPVPFAEGDDLDREVLGLREWPNRTPIVLHRRSPTKWSVNAGSMHGLNQKTILAVFPPAGDESKDAPIGHIEVSPRITLLEAEVTPCPYEGTPEVNDLPDGGRCEIVSQTFGDFHVTVAADPLDNQGNPAPADQVQRIQKDLESLSQKDFPLVHLESTIAAAKWVVRADQGKVYLIPAGGVQVRGIDESPLFGPVPSDKEQRDWLAGSLTQIARVNNLLKIANSADSGQQTTGLRVEVQLLRFKGLDDQMGEPVAWTGEGKQLHVNDIIGFRVRNPNEFAVDVSLLFVDSGYGVTAFWPEPGTAMTNRVPAGKTILTPKGEVNDATTGLEHMLVIAVEAQARPTDFSFLEQPKLDRAKSAPGSRGSATDVLSTEFGQFLEQASYLSGQRGLGKAIRERCSIQAVSWRIAAEGK